MNGENSRNISETFPLKKEPMYQLLAETANEIIITLDFSGTITYINKKGIEITGYSMEEAIGTNIISVIADEQAESAKKLLALRVAGNKEIFLYETEILIKGRKKIPVEVSSTVIEKEGKSFGVLLIARDITERKRVENRLKESENRYRALINTMNEGLVEVDKDWNITFTNKKFIEMIGYNQEEIVGRSFHDISSADCKAKAREEHEKRLQGKTERYELELVRSDGEKIFVLCSPKPDYDSNGQYIGGLGVISDITELKISIDKLQKEEERFKFLAENMADIVWTLDMEFKTTYVSPSIEKVLGFTPEERRGQKLEEVVTPESLDRIATGFLEELKFYELQGIGSDRSVTIEVEYYHKDGSIVWLENSVKPMRNQEGELVGIYGTSRDVTERKMAQKALTQEKERLQDALDKIKKLGGLLPICGHCKKIRNDEGYWDQIEAYIQNHSEAEFSHSICPECAKEFYPDMDIY